MRRRFTEDTNIVHLKLAADDMNDVQALRAFYEVIRDMPSDEINDILWNIVYLESDDWGG